LLALKPFVFPAPKPEKPGNPKPPPAPTQARPKHKASSALAYPCVDCADAFPCDYCDACKTEWNKRKQQEFEQRTAKQRASYARRRARAVSRRPPKLCASCGKEFKSKRSDARFCSSRCRQRARRQGPVTDKSHLTRSTLFIRDAKRLILAAVDRYPAVFLNDLLPSSRTKAQYQALCKAARLLEETGEIASWSYWVRWDRPGFLALTKPGHEINSKSHIPHLKPEERAALITS
jgi:hypothetical protein